MSIYQALQLNAAGSKHLIRNAETRTEKIKWSLVYLLKVILTIMFCVSFVTISSFIFGNDNSITGVVILIILLTVRQSNFGIHISHSSFALILTFAILIIGPKLYNITGPFIGFFINLFCILAITVLSCHNVIMSNHFVFILSYLLLIGYNVTDKSFHIRIIALIFGAILCTFIFLITHKKQKFKRNFFSLFKEFNIFSTRTQWQIKISLGISSAMLIASLLGLPRVMWVGICVMSLMTPFSKDLYNRTKIRAPFNILGCLLFVAINFLIPESLKPLIGIIGGIGVGFSAKYSWQNIFNAVSALSIAVGIYGILGAIMLRITTNVFGSIYSLFFDKLYKLFINIINDICTIQTLDETL